MAEDLVSVNFLQEFPDLSDRNSSVINYSPQWRDCAVSDTHMNAADMTNSTSTMLTLRQEPLRGLELFCRALRKAVTLDHLRPVEMLDALRLGSAAECVQCGFHLTGEELLELARPASPVESVSSSFGRLRLGYCARKDCDSFYYRLTFRCMPQLDWRSLLPRIDAIQQELARQPAHLISSVSLLNNAAKYPWLRRVRIILATLGLTLFIATLWLAYHYSGTPSDTTGLRTDSVQEDSPTAQ
jgi:hypothetical protein